MVCQNTVEEIVLYLLKFMWCHNNHGINKIGSYLLEVACQVYIFIQEKLTSRAFSKDLNIKERTIKSVIDFKIPRI